MERYCGMDGYIFTKDDIMAMNNSKTRMRLTKSLDKLGIYRIQTKVSTYIMQFTFEIVEVVNLLWIVIFYPQVWIDHFYYMKEETKNFTHMLYGVVGIASFYMFAVMADRYAYKISISTQVHHWFSIFAAVSVLHKNFSPFATWYAIWGIFFTFPVDIMLFIRLRYAHRFPGVMKMGFKLLTIYYVFLVCTVIIGQSLLFFNGYWGYGKGKFEPFYAIYLFIGIIGLMYDDYNLVKAFWNFSNLDYTGTQFIRRTKLDDIADNLEMTSVSRVTSPHALSTNSPPMDIPAISAVQTSSAEKNVEILLNE